MTPPQVAALLLLPASQQAEYSPPHAGRQVMHVSAPLVSETELLPLRGPSCPPGSHRSLCLPVCLVDGLLIGWVGGWVWPSSSSSDPAARLVLYLFVIERAPDMFRAGFVMLDRARQRPVLSTTGREIDEQYCKELLQDFLGFQGKEGRRAMKRLGVRPSKSATAKETFAQLVESVYRQRESVAAATEPQPTAGEVPGVGQGEEPLTAAA